MFLLLFPDVVCTNQHKAAGSQKDQDDEKTSEDATLETENQEEDLEDTVVQELKPEQLDSRKFSHKGKGCCGLPLWFSSTTSQSLSSSSPPEGADSSEMELQSLEDNVEEDKWREGQNSRERQTERTRESTYHTDPELLLMDNMQVGICISQDWTLVEEAWWNAFPHNS